MIFTSTAKTQVLIKMKKKVALLIVVLGLSCAASQAQTNAAALPASQNPFPSSTSIKIHALDNDTVTFKVHNLLGQTVAEFFDSIVLSGTFTVGFYADTLSDGDYLAILTKNGENHSLRLLKDQSVTSLPEDQNTAAEIHLFPNPTDNRVTVPTDLSLAEVEVYDVAGKRVMKSIFKGGNTVDLSGLDRGLYLLHLKGDDRTFVRRVVKR